MKKFLSLFIALCLLMITVIPIFAAETSDKVFEQAVDFSPIAPGTEVWADGGKVTHPNAYSEAGIWVDDPASFGLGADKLDHNGVRSGDANGDGFSDSIYFFDVGNHGCRFTLGFNKQNDFTGAEAIAIRLYNPTGNGWGKKEFGHVKLTLYDTDGNAYSMLESKKTPKGTVSSFISLAEKTLTTRYVPISGYSGFLGKEDGWYIIDLSAFEAGLDISKLAKINFDIDTRAGYYPGIKNIGFVYDIGKFVKNEIGIDYKEPKEIVYNSAVDFSPVAPGTEVWADGGVVTYPNAYSEAGIWVDDTASLGLGADKLDHNGIRSADTNKDGISDVIYFYDVGMHGCRFTIGFNRQKDFTGATAIAINMGKYTGYGFPDGSIAQLTMTLYDTDGHSYPMLTPDKVSNETVSSFAMPESEDYISTNVSTDGYCGMVSCKSGWYVIDLTAFGTELDVSKLDKIKFDITTHDNWYPAIYDIGFINDSMDFVHGVTNFIGYNRINLTAEDNLNVNFTVNGETMKKAMPGETVLVNATPSGNEEVYLIKVIDKSGKEIPVNGTSFVMPESDVTVFVSAGVGSVKIPVVDDMYSNIWDISDLTCADYRDDAEKRDLALDTSSELYKSGIIVNREPIGAGKTSTNFHGFWADDFNNDGIVEKLRIDPYDTNGVRFTAGINTTSIPENSEAIVVRIDNRISEQAAGHLMRLNLALHGSKGKTSKLKTDDSNAVIHFIEEINGTVSTYKLMDTNAILPAEMSGWVVIPLDSFKGLTDLKNYNALAFDIESELSTFTSIHEIGVTNDIDEFFRIVKRNPTLHNINFASTEKGTVSANYNSAKAGTKVTLKYSLNDNYIVDTVKLKYGSGKEVPLDSKNFIMPNDSITIIPTFKEAAFKSYKKLKDLKTTIIDIDLPKASYDATNGETEFTELLEKGLLVKNEDVGFRVSGNNKAYNLNGLYIEENSEGDKGLRLWTHDTFGMSVTLKADEVKDHMEYNSIALYIDNEGCPEYTDSNGPYFALELFTHGDDGVLDIKNSITVKPTDQLWGTTVTLVDDTTGIVTEVPLGYSPEEASSLDNNEKYYSQFFLPNGFKGWILVPFDYFNKNFDDHSIGAVRFDYKSSYWYYRTTIYEAALVSSVEDFLRVATLPNYSVDYEEEDIEIIDKSVFELYKDTDRTVRVNVNKDFIPQYFWTFKGDDITKFIDLNPIIKRLDENESNLNKFYNNFEETVIYKIEANDFPGKATISFDVSWDFGEDTKVTLYRYDPATGKFDSLKQTNSPKLGFIGFDFTSGGYYALSSTLPTNESVDTVTKEPDKDKNIITNTQTITENRGHYETIPGKEKYKTVTKITYGSLQTWFIIVLVVIGLVLVSGVVVTVLLVKKCRRSKNV